MMMTRMEMRDGLTDAWLHSIRDHHAYLGYVATSHLMARNLLFSF